MASKSRKIFVNLPVEDLDKSVEFFTALGFEFNPQFTDSNATCMIVNDDAFVMLLVEDFFKTFTTNEIADSSSTETILALSAASREDVDELVEKAVEAGGKSTSDAKDQGSMYGGSFQDLDGHLWEVFYMDADSLDGDDTAPDEGGA